MSCFPVFECSKRVLNSMKETSAGTRPAPFAAMQQHAVRMMPAGNFFDVRQDSILVWLSKASECIRANRVHWLVHKGICMSLLLELVTSLSASVHRRLAAATKYLLHCMTAACKRPIFQCFLGFESPNLIEIRNTFEIRSRVKYTWKRRLRLTLRSNSEPLSMFCDSCHPGA